MTLDRRAGGRAGGVLAACLLAAMLEGLDLQATGVAAPRLGAALHLDPGRLGLVFALGTLGLLPGALIGGRLADRLGRRRLLMAAMAIYGIFSLATVAAGDFASLAAMRFLTGAGLGAALPNLIALAAEAVPPSRRSQAVSLVYAGMPLGGVVAAVVGLLSRGPAGWHAIFLLGGTLPLLLLPLLAGVLPGGVGPAGATPRGDYADALFGGGRRAATLLLWVCFFFTLLVVYLLLNWLPSLLLGRGLSRPQAAAVQILFNLGGVAGSLGFGWLMDRRSPRLAVACMYGGVIAALAGLIAAQSLPETAAAGFASGLFVVGGQAVLYALAPAVYARPIRGTGVGAAVGIGRIGAVAGPAAAGMILSHGHGPAGVLGAALPGIVVATGAGLVLLRKMGRTGGEDAPAR